MPDNSKVAEYLTEISAIAADLLAALGAAGPAAVVGEFGKLAGLALAAYQEAAGTAITPETVLQLLPDQTPLKTPAAG